MISRLKNFHFHAAIFLFYLGIAVAMTYPLILRMGTGIYGPFFKTDVRGTIWSLWWLKYAALHHVDYNNCFFLGAPFGIDLSFLPILSVNFLISRLLVVLAGPVVSVNLMTLILFALTGLFGYWLVDRLTRDRAAALISGFIFAFCPYHLNKVMEFTYVFLGTGLVLYVFALIRLRERSDIRWIALAAIAFTLTTAFCAYYGFFAAFFTAGLLLFSCFYQWRDKLAALRTPGADRRASSDSGHALRLARDIALVLLLFALFNAPSLWGILKKIYFSSASAAGGSLMDYARSFDYLTAQSARPLSYLLPASTHPVFGGFTRSMFGSFFYGRGSVEQTLYLGWLPLILAYRAFARWKHKRSHADLFPGYGTSQDNFYIGFFVFSAWAAFVFSLPPIVDLGIFRVYLPSFFCYKIFPMFRAYARFGIVVMLCVAVLAGYGLRDILERIRRRNIRFLFLFVVFSAILFEFTNVPPSRVTDISKVPDVYAWLAGQEGDFIVAEYPMVLNPQGEAQENYDYLFEQTRHHKRLMNGILQGSRGAALKDKIVKIENPDAPVTLLSLGVKYVILHEDLYREGGHRQAVDVIGDVPALDSRPGFKRVKTFKDVSVFEIV